jgi:hypothetical protein
MTLPTSPEEIAELKELGRLRTEQRDRAEAEVRELRAALRPFAESERYRRQTGYMGRIAACHFARAAELVPEENT